MIGDEPAGILSVGRESVRAAGQTLAGAGEITHSAHCCTINDNGVHPDPARSQQATSEIHKLGRCGKWLNKKAARIGSGSFRSSTANL